MKKVLILLVLLPSPCFAIPVIPNFSAGNSISRTTSSSETREIIRSYSYSTGYQYTTGGSNIEPLNGGVISPPAVNGTPTTINGITSTTTGIDLNNKPQWKQSVSGANTQFHESYMGPGLNSFVEIDRTINIQSVTESTSTFTQ
jgi:hypothetical protein